MEIKAVQDRINRERRRNDVAEVCKDVGATVTLFYRAMNRQTAEELTAKERKILVAFIDRLDSHKADDAKLQQSC